VIAPKQALSFRFSMMCLYIIYIWIYTFICMYVYIHRVYSVPQYKSETLPIHKHFAVRCLNHVTTMDDQSLVLMPESDTHTHPLGTPC
jgi:hypothetical protein